MESLTSWFVGYKWSHLHRGLWVINWVTYIMVCGFSFCFPCHPFFLREFTAHDGQSLYVGQIVQSTYDVLVQIYTTNTTIIISGKQSRIWGKCRCWFSVFCYLFPLYEAWWVQTVWAERRDPSIRWELHWCTESNCKEVNKTKVNISQQMT